ATSQGLVARFLRWAYQAKVMKTLLHNSSRMLTMNGFMGQAREGDGQILTGGGSAGKRSQRPGFPAPATSTVGRWPSTWAPPTATARGDAAAAAAMRPGASAAWAMV